jgi:protein phosphatase
VALVGGDAATILHVGDSRAALWRRGSFVATTYDHNDVGDLLRTGAITSEEARHYPGRNLIREVIGLADGYHPECQRWDLETGDVLLLCTDGLTESLSDESICHLIATSPTAAAAASTLVAVAGVEGGTDNATAIVCKII